MKKAFLIASACLVAACGDSTSPVDGLVIDTAVSAEQITAGQNVSVTLTILNQRDTDVKVAVESCQRPFDVLNKFGVVVGPGARQVCTLALTAPTTIAAGQTATFETQWAGDSLGIGPADGPQYLSPGAYFIRGRVYVIDDNATAFGRSVGIAIKPE
jgi:hypothetical protein